MVRERKNRNQPNPKASRRASARLRDRMNHEGSTGPLNSSKIIIGFGLGIGGVLISIFFLGGSPKVQKSPDGGVEITPEGFTYSTVGLEPLSQVLRTAVEASKEFLSQGTMIETYLGQGGPMHEFIKAHLQPIQARVSSLRTQTSQYEQMTAKVPGGPTAFIASTLAELKEHEGTLIRLELQVVELLNRESTVTGRLQEEGINAMNKAQLIIQSATFDRLGKAGIFIGPEHLYGPMDDNWIHSKEADPVYLVQEAEAQGYSLQHILHLFLRLAQLYEDLETKRAKAEEVFERKRDENEDVDDSEMELGMRRVRMDPETLIAINDLQEAEERVAAEIKRNGEKYRLFFPLNFGARLKIGEYCKKLMDMNSLQLPYIQLSGDIGKEIRRLRTRLEKLRAG